MIFVSFKVYRYFHIRAKIGYFMSVTWGYDF